MTDAQKRFESYVALYVALVAAGMVMGECSDDPVSVGAFLDRRCATIYGINHETDAQFYKTAVPVLIDLAKQLIAYLMVVE